MAVISTNESGAINSREGGTIDLLSYSKEYTRIFQVVVDNPLDTPFTVVQGNPNIPGLMTVHPSDGTAFCVGYQPTRRSGTRDVWDVSVLYSNQVNQDSPSDGNPINEPTILEIRPQKFDFAPEKDINGKRIVNSAEVPFDPPPTTPYAHWVATYTRNELVFFTGNVDPYLNHVNSTPFMGFPEKTVLCTAITARNAFWNGAQYYTVTYEFEYNPLTWQLELLDAGYMEIGLVVEGLQDPVFKLKRIETQEGLVTTDPWPLDGSGAALADELASDPANLTYLKFDVYESADFNALSL